MENIGRYHIERELGRGAMGIVYLAQHPSMDRMVAIKTFRIPDGEDGEFQNRDRLRAEADRAGGLDHPNIVKIYDVDEQGDPPYIVMEYVDGPTLDQLLTTDAPDSDQSISILRQAAEALDYAHHQRIIHRDIKPANLMLDSKNMLKITDFGIAKRAGANTQTTSRFMGTPEYMAPEQLEGRPDIDGRADQFALATIAYQLVTGRKPFEADTVTAISHLIANKNPVPPSQVNHSLGKQVDAVIGKAHSKSRDRRYATCTEFTDALEIALLAPARRAVPVWVPFAAAGALLVALFLVGALFDWWPDPFGWRTSPNKLAMTVDPPSVVLKPLQSQQFKVLAGNDSPSVAWTLAPPGVGTISESGVYRAPSDAVTEQAVTVTATNLADKSMRVSASIQLTPAPTPDPQLVVTPARAVLQPGQSQQFSASGADVRWSVTPSVGTITRTGLYRSPLHNVVEQKVTVLATNSGLHASAELLLTAEAQPVASFSLQALSRSVPIPKGAVFGDNDERLGYLGVGHLRCKVKSSGAHAGNGELRLVWYVNGDEMSNKPLPPAQGEQVIDYGNLPEPGVYRIKLMAGPAVRAETTFTIKKGTQ
ncbi:MAG: protein kinase [Candidatus Solibacter sp.]